MDIYYFAFHPFRDFYPPTILFLPVLLMETVTEMQTTTVQLHSMTAFNGFCSVTDVFKRQGLRVFTEYAFVCQLSALIYLTFHNS